MALTSAEAKTLTAFDEPKSRASKLSRSFDYLVVPIILLALMAAMHVHVMLTAGDWDFWVDWKDRQYWVTITPILLIMLPAAVAYIFWEKFRLPIAGTLMAVALLIGEWMNRYFGFYLWSNFPIALVWPAQVIPGFIALDVILMLTRNYIATAIVGGMTFGLLFYPQNWVMLAQYHLPINFHGILISVADQIGYTFSRTATPEYLRLIERGTLRTFGGNSATVASFFASFVCILMYMLWWNIGRFITGLGWSRSNRLKTFMGFGQQETVKEAEGLA